ncbi:hypothetical protein HPB51_022590 [Rhipicephalus microplus]|uniref:Cyclase family protein n=1 Tax=Rhipicephalus microplus TaxID=6941 RepID=A0A9J6DWP7_RHIMP|nr:hypothetical protein HPB51_022590 [Rhipicephalus microplus]
MYCSDKKRICENSGRAPLYRCENQTQLNISHVDPLRLTLTTSSECESIQYYNNRNAFYGTDQYGLRHFPAIEPAAVEFLTRQRNLAGVGIETASVDFYGFTRSHHLLAAANVYILENLADLSLVPPVGAHAIVMPMKIDGAGGAPTRVAALLP